MSPVTATARRTLSRLRTQFSTALVLAGFLSATAVAFAFRLDDAEGTRQALATLWATSVAPFLPVLAAFAAMGVWSEERRSRRLDLLLSVAVCERDYVIGKALGVWFLLLAATFLSLLSSVVLLAFLAPSALADVKLLSFAPALAVLALQGVLWTSVSVAASAMCTNALTAAAGSLAVTVALPRGLWEAAKLWAAEGRPAFGEMPLDAMVADFSSGLVSTGAVVSFAVLSLLAVFLATKSVGLSRLAGRGGFRGRLSSFLAMALAVVCALSVVLLAFRLDLPVDLQVGSTRMVSVPMRRLLADMSGRAVASVFLSRKSPEFRPVAQYMRALKRQAESTGGIALTLQFVDPDWDLGAAGRLVRLGAQENAIVFEKGGRVVSLPLKDGYGDRAVATALRSIALPPKHRDVYWTTGHGEASFQDYGSWGLSDIARELVRRGYRNETFDLTADRPIPSDCALIAVAGAREPFSRSELTRLDSYLRGGGRLLVMMGPSAEGGVASMLPAWGIRPLASALAGARTVSGTDVVVSDFADHVVSSGMAGSRLLLEKPLSFGPSAVAGSGSGADRLEFSSVARVGGSCLGAAGHRGGAAGADLAVRPARIVAIGDPSFVSNGPLAVRGNANGTFFVNAVSYLSGTDVSGGEPEPGVLASGLGRAERMRFLQISAMVFPGLVFLLSAAGVLLRRGRK